MAEHLDRRRFLAGLGAASLLAACGGNGSGGATDARATSAASAGTGRDGSNLTLARFSAPHVAIADGTEQRTVWGVADVTVGPLRRHEVPDTVLAAVSFEGELIAPATEVAMRAEGLVFPYFPVRARFDVAGVYDVSLSFDDNVLESVVQVFDPGEVELVQPGQPLPRVQTPTVEDPRGVEPICTRPEGTCAFHDRTLAEALTADDRPSILIVGTPGFCQTAVCGPMLELVAAEHERTAGAFTTVHAEVYADPGALPDSAPTEVMDATGLAAAGYEPAVFLADAAGVLVERLDNVVDGSELGEAVDRLLT